MMLNHVIMNMTMTAIILETIQSMYTSMIWKNPNLKNLKKSNSIKLKTEVKENTKKSMN